MLGNEHIVSIIDVGLLLHPNMVLEQGNKHKAGGPLNIARGTTDPEIDSVTWTKFANIMARLALVSNLATR